MIFKKEKSLRYGMEEMEGFKYIKATRDYLDYLEEHLTNVAKAFAELSDACDGMQWVGDDYTWHALRQEILKHDLSKFSKEEFVQYRNKFFKINDCDDINVEFKKAFEHHKVNNTHHWESIRTDCFGNIEKDIVHMVVDWTAMGYKFGGTAEEYYISNKDKIVIPDGYEDFIQELFDKIRKFKHKN